MQYKKPDVEIEIETKQAHREIAYRIMLTTMAFAILVTYFTK